MKFEIIRKIDKLGRLCIPKDFRKSLKITEKSEILITVTEEGILLKNKQTEQIYKKPLTKQIK